MRLPFWMRKRVDGVEATSWQNSVYTRHRTDLPYEDRSRLKLQGFSDEQIDELILSMEQMLRGEGEVIRERPEDG